SARRDRNRRKRIRSIRTTMPSWLIAEKRSRPARSSMFRRKRKSKSKHGLNWRCLTPELLAGNGYELRRSYLTRSQHEDTKQHKGNVVVSLVLCLSLVVNQGARCIYLDSCQTVGYSQTG